MAGGAVITERIRRVLQVARERGDLATAARMEGLQCSQCDCDPVVCFGCRRVRGVRVRMVADVRLVSADEAWALVWAVVGLAGVAFGMVGGAVVAEVLGLA